MNKVFLIGRMTKDAEANTLQSGHTYARFSLAVDRNRKDADGNKEVDFFNCVAWDKTAEIVVNYGGKGKQIAVCGSVQFGSYDGKDGVKRFTTDVVVNEVQLLGSKTENSDSNIDNLTPTDDDMPF